METRQERLRPAGFPVDYKRQAGWTAKERSWAPLVEWLFWLATPGAQAIARSRGWL